MNVKHVVPLERCLVQTVEAFEQEPDELESPHPTLEAFLSRELHKDVELGQLGVEECRDKIVLS